MYETTDDAMQDWCDSRMEADMEQAQMESDARYYDAERKAGRCQHMGAGVGYREMAFYPQQIGLSPGQTFCYDCKEAYASDLDCWRCGLPKWHCGGERGWSEDHTAFVTPPMVRVCNVTE